MAQLPRAELRRDSTSIARDFTCGHRCSKRLASVRRTEGRSSLCRGWSADRGWRWILVRVVTRTPHPEARDFEHGGRVLRHFGELLYPHLPVRLIRQPRGALCTWSQRRDLGDVHL